MTKRVNIEIIPAIDIIDGKCVRLQQGDYSCKTIYNENPLEVAKEFEANGIKRLHLVDLDGARAHQIINYKVLERIATATQLTIDFGGGLKSNNDLRIAFESGAQMVTGGSIAVKDSETFLSWIAQYGAERIILGADVKNGNIAVSGWEEESDIPLMPFVQRYMDSGINKVITTDISKDGMLQGAATELYAEMLQQLSGIYLIASGGISSVADIEALEQNSVPAVILGKAIYEGRVSLKELQRFAEI